MFNPFDPANRSKVAMLSNVVLGLFWLALVTGTHIPFDVDLSAPQGGDKVLHFGAYAGLAFLIATTWQLNAGFLTGRHLFLVWLAAALFGIADEITQTLVGRDCSLGDWTADILGAATGILAFVLLRRILQSRLSPNE